MFIYLYILILVLLWIFVLQFMVLFNIYSFDVGNNCKWPIGYNGYNADIKHFVQYLQLIES